MLHFEGERDFSLVPADLWPKLRDAAFLVTCIPDATIKGQPARDEGQCTVRPGFAFVRGTLEVTIRIVDGVEPTSLKFMLLSKGIGSSSDVETNLTIEKTDAGSRVRWVADVQLGGLLKAIPSGLIRGAAQKTIEDVWNGIGRKLQEV
ncbi:MAG: hypothetical protein L0Y72_16230 [Gemmataceae bacterium]|nr:hypothetical protein [Gemmataceae bacterium]MCI0740596.1 hypothetical protein [Gemmataceae bacterium]